MVGVDGHEQGGLKERTAFEGTGEGGERGFDLRVQKIEVSIVDQEKGRCEDRVQNPGPSSGVVEYFREHAQGRKEPIEIVDYQEKEA